MRKNDYEYFLIKNLLVMFYLKLLDDKEGYDNIGSEYDWVEQLGKYGNNDEEMYKTFKVQGQKKA